MKWRSRCKWCLIPSFLGMFIFFVVPFFRVLYYSVINNQFQRQLVGFSNYVKLFSNHYFRLAMGNTLLLIVVCVPALMVLAISISLMLSYGITVVKSTRFAFILPMVIPTASIVLIWQFFFGGVKSVLPIYLLYVWKNMGICIVLITAAFTTIPKSVYEAAKLDGASPFFLHWEITIPMSMPTICFAVLLSIVNSFRIFKESYLYYGSNYPPDSSYTLQYYMNNNFLKLDYQSLATSSVVTSIVILLIVIVGMKIQKRCAL